MTNESLAALRALVSSDPAFADALGAAATPADAVSVAAGRGFTVSAADLDGLTGLELSDADLETVSGGLSQQGVSYCTC